MSKNNFRCATIQRFTDTYLDEEFAEADRLDFERHLDECDACRRTVRDQAHWHKVVKNAAPREEAPSALRAQLERRISREVGREHRMRVWTRRAVPTLAAAAMVVAYFAVPTRGIHSAAFTADLVAKHQRNMPVEVSGGNEQIKQWYADKVGFPVRPPQFEPVVQTAGMAAGMGNGNPYGQQRTARLKGGRLADIRDRQAAYLVYEVNGNKVSVFMFDPQEMPMQAKRRAVVNNREVYLDEDHGYNVALFRDHGVGYAIASDMDEGSMINLVSATVGR